MTSRHQANNYYYAGLQLNIHNAIKIKQKWDFCETPFYIYSQILLRGTMLKKLRTVI